MHETLRDISGEPVVRRLEQLLAAKRIDARAGVQSIELCGVRIDKVKLRAVLRSIYIQISQRQPGYIVTPNVDHICLLQDDAKFRNAYNHALLSLPDGKPLLWAGRLLRTPLRAKLSGSDLIYRVSQFAAANGFSVYFLGAAEGVGAEAARRLQELYRGLEVAGVISPPLGFEQDPELNGRILRQLAESGADICFVALGSPKQEIWMSQNVKESRVPVMIGVGASFDFVTGRAKRAPSWMQEAGLEWFWRLCHEPRRLWRRYLVRDTRFFLLLGMHLASRYRMRFRSGGAG